jgi:ribosomal protein S18 acetylase RimI-like enzyme
MLALAPASQGVGLGRAVVDWVAMEATRVSANLWATVSDFNTPARQFYARLGFIELAELGDLVKDGFSEILLRRRLR